MTIKAVRSTTDEDGFITWYVHGETKSGHKAGLTYIVVTKPDGEIDAITTGAQRYPVVDRVRDVIEGQIQWAIDKAIAIENRA